MVRLFIGKVGVSMSKIKKVRIENGYYLFKLEKLLSDNNTSINKLMKDTNTDYKVIKRLIDGEVVRIDITVLARLCEYFDCEITDIFEYVR